MSNRSLSGYQSDERLSLFLVPDTHRPVFGTGDEELLHGWVPADGVDAPRVSRVGVQRLLVVGTAAPVDGALFGADQVRIAVRGMKIECRRWRELGNRRAFRLTGTGV